MSNKKSKSIINVIVRVFLSTFIFLAEIVSVGESAWIAAFFFGASLVFVVLPMSVLPLWSWRKRYIVSLIFFILAVVFSPPYSN